MPAAVMTFGSLSSDILGYSERPNDAELQAQIPQLIMLAENDCAVDLRVLGTEIVATASMTSLGLGEAVVPKPQYWRRTVSINITVPGTGRVELKKRTYEYLRNFWPVETVQGVPRFYAEYNAENFIVAPTPAADYEFELIYAARLEPLSDSAQDNWLTQNAPQLLLYGSMYHTSLYLKNFARADSWKAQYNSTLEGLKTENGTRKYDRTTVEG